MTEQVVQNGSTKVHGPKGFLSEHHLDRYENWLDSKLRIPADAWKMGARKRVLARMAGNVGLDLTLGAIPLVGDLFDFVFKSNVKNLKLHRAERQRLSSLR
jgi:hypothetical protein